MKLLSYLGIPVLVAAIAVVYWFITYETAGTVLLVIFGIAMALMGWILVPTVNDIGPTAPVDPDWHETRD